MAVMKFARPDGQWFDFPPLAMAAASGNRLLRPGKLDLLPLPEGATLTLMPGATRQELRKAIDGHVLSVALLSASYEHQDLDDEDWSEDGLD